MKQNHDIMTKTSQDSVYSSSVIQLAVLQSNIDRRPGVCARDRNFVSCLIFMVSTQHCRLFKNDISTSMMKGLVVKIMVWRFIISRLNYFRSKNRNAVAETG